MDADDRGAVPQFPYLMKLPVGAVERPSPPGMPTQPHNGYVTAWFYDEAERDAFARINRAHLEALEAFPPEATTETP